MSGEMILWELLLLTCWLCRFADKNPLEILLIFMGEQNLRLVDLFRTFDKDQSGGLTRDEFIVGLQV